jgi:hypothetical protein
VMLHSSVVNELVEVESGFAGSCVGVRVVCHCVVLVRRRCQRRASSTTQRQLWALWLDGEWIEFGLPSTRVDSELRSKVGGARGASPADASSTVVSTRPRHRVFTAARFKAFWLWGSSRSGWRWVSPTPMTVGGGGRRCGWSVRWPWFLVIFFFF